MNGKNLSEQLAFSKLYEAYAPMVYRRCMFLLKDEAEVKDMVQNVFLRVYEHMDSLNLSQPSSLLWNTATRLCLNRIRDKKRRGLDVDTSDLLLSIACAEDDEGAEARGILARIFSKEQESTRTIATLHFVDGMTLEETAETGGVSGRGVRKRVRTLKARMRNLDVER